MPKQSSMDNKENKKNLVRRSERTPKPKKKEAEQKVKNLAEDIAKMYKKKANVETLASTVSASVETTADDTAMCADKAMKKTTTAEEVFPSTSQLSTSSVIGFFEKKAKTAKKLGLFVIDCEAITGDKKINIDAFKTYLQQNLKNDGKINDERINIEKQNMQVLINAEIYVEQNYIKYLIKKYLKSTNLHTWIKIVKGKKMFTLTYITM